MWVAAARDVLTLSHHIGRPDWLITLESAKVCAHPSIAGDLCFPGGISTLNSVCCQVILHSCVTESSSRPHLWVCLQVIWTIKSNCRSLEWVYVSYCKDENPHSLNKFTLWPHYPRDSDPGVNTLNAAIGNREKVFIFHQRGELKPAVSSTDGTMSVSSICVSSVLEQKTISMSLEFAISRSFRESRAGCCFVCLVLRISGCCSLKLGPRAFILEDLKSSVCQLKAAALALWSFGMDRR